MSSIKDKVAIVTGGSRGIGRAIVLKLARQGCHVAFNYLNSEEAAKKLESEVTVFGVKCKASCLDVKDLDAVKNWVNEVKEESGQLDILINNAGIISDKPLMTMTKDDWDRVLDTNLSGIFNMSKACIVTFMKQKQGHIINISSVSGIIGLPGQVNYSSAKGGMNAFTKALAKEVAPFNVNVNAVAAGFIDTDILKEMNEKHKEEALKAVPLGRVGTVDDVASAVSFLLSDAAGYITGQIIQVDGGLAIR